MKAQSQPKLTKRQLKALRGPNAAVQRSLNQGSSIKIAGRNYRGRNPDWFGKGAVPFVRSN